MKTSTNPMVSPAQRCQLSTSRCTTARIDFVRAGMAGARTLTDTGASQRNVDEGVGIGLFDLHLLVLWIELGEHAPLLLGCARRHPAVAGEHRDLLFQRAQVRDAIRPADLGWNHGED